MNYQEAAHKLYKQQTKDWPQLADNLEGFNEIKHKIYQFNGFTLETQFNPKRILSTNAKIDKKSLENRQCFLCKKFRNKVQKAVIFENKYEILCNPFPILHNHFTVSLLEHLPQAIKHRFVDILNISKALPELFVLYNGPKCGASAPDHHHFQAAATGYLPIEKDITELKNLHGQKISTSFKVTLTKVDDGMRRFLILESNNKNDMDKLFQIIYDEMPLKEDESEPMMNILSWYKNLWRVLIFLREKHRPWQFFEQGDDNILISPGSTDFGGILITPLEKDFKKMTEKKLADILNQVSLNANAFDRFCNSLTNILA